MPISAETNEKQTVSARVNKLVYDEYKKSELPISTIVEAGLIYFLKLDEEEKMKYISQNIPETVERKDLKPLKKPWPDFLKEMLVAIGIPAAVSATIVLGPFSSIATLFTSGLLIGNSISRNAKNKKNGKEE